MSPKIRATQKQSNTTVSNSNQLKAVVSKASGIAIQTSVYDAVQNAKQANGHSGQEGRVPTLGQQNDQVTALLNGRSVDSIQNAKSSQANELIPASVRLDALRSGSETDLRARAKESKNNKFANPYAGSSGQRPADENVKGINLGLNISDHGPTYAGQQSAGFQGSASSSGKPTGIAALPGSTTASNPMGAFNGSVNLTGAVGEAASKTSGPAMPKGTDMIASGVVGGVLKEVGKDQGLEYAWDKVFGPGSSDSTLYKVIDNGLNVLEVLKWENPVGGVYAAGKLIVAVVEKAVELWPGPKDGGRTGAVEQRAESEKRRKAEQQQAEEQKLAEDWWEVEQRYEAEQQKEASTPDPEGQKGPTALGQYLRNASGYNHAQQAGRKGSADGTPVDGRGDAIVGQVTGVVPDQQQRMVDMFGQPVTEGWSQRLGDPTGGTNWGSSTGAGVVRPGDDGVYSGGAGPELDPLRGNPPAMGVGADTTRPAVTGLSVNGSSLTLTLSESLKSTVPEAARFRVLVGGAVRAVSSASVNGDGKTVTLQLASAVTNGQAVTMAYTDKSTSNDTTGVIEDLAGNDLATFAARTVINATPVPAATVGLQNVAVGTAGNDIITGQVRTRESLEGKAGEDRFRFGNTTSYGLASADRVIDFSRGQGDRVEISRQAFGLSGATALSFTQAANARDLATALGSSTLFIQDQRDGSLWFNQNGSSVGAGTGGVFAQFTNGVTLQASDLSLIA